MTLPSTTSNDPRSSLDVETRHVLDLKLHPCFLKVHSLSVSPCAPLGLSPPIPAPPGLLHSGRFRAAIAQNKLFSLVLLLPLLQRPHIVDGSGQGFHTSEGGGLNRQPSW